MNKLRNSFIFLFLSWLMAGCTLMMEDYSIPEEERGVGEVYTEEIDGVGTISYQYNEGVTPVTSTAQDFIAQVEKDSVIYFYDHIPQKLLPKVGGYVAAGCSRTLPYGLYHLVKSVEHVTGLYKVVLQTATMDDIYAELEIDLDFEYPTPTVVRDSTSTDTIYTDWSLVDKQNGVSPFTRAGDDKKEDEDEFDKNTEKTSTMKIVYDTRGNIALNDAGLLSSALKLVLDPLVWAVKKKVEGKKIKGVELADLFFLNFEYNRSTTTRVQHKKSKKNKYEKQVNTVVETSSFKSQIGIELKPFDLGERFKGNNTEEILHYIKDYNTTLRSISPESRREINEIQGELEKGNYFKKLNIEAKKEGLKKLNEIITPVRVPLGTLPLAIVLTPHIEANFSFTGDLSFYTETKTTTVTGYEISGNKRTEFKEDPKQTKSQALVGNGHISATIGGGGGIGTEFLGSVGVLCKAIIALTGEANVPLTFYGDTQFANQESFIKFTTNWSVVLDFYVNFWKLDIWNKQVTLFAGDIDFLTTKISVYPEFKLSPTPTSLTRANDDVYLRFKYDVGDRGILATWIDTYPKLAIYKYKKNVTSTEKRFSDENLVAEISPTMPGNDYLTSDELIKKNGSYSFTYIIDEKNYEDDMVYAAVPMVYNASTENTTKFSNLAAEFKDPTPSIAVTSMYQTAALPYNDEFNFGEPEGFYDFGGSIGSAEGRDDLAQYDFTVILDVNNPAMMKEWGVILDVTYKSMELISNRYVEINRKKSGQYTLNFSFLCNVKTDLLDLTTVITPYYLDSKGYPHYVERGEITMTYPLESTTQRGSGENIDINL